MEEIIAPVDKELILAELTPDKLQRKTNHGDNEIYVVNWQNAPNTVREIGRLREISFRQAGGSAGLAMDLDEFDTMENPYQQLLVWDPDAQAIIGGYRYILGSDIKIGEDGQPVLATSHMFHFSEEFVRDYIPHTIELGRSFVTPDYQSSKAGAKALFALDNLWDGLATLMVHHPNMYFFFGKMTMYPSYDPLGRDLILHFLWKHFGGSEHLVQPIDPVVPQLDRRVAGLILKEEEFKKDYVCLKDAIKSLGTSIPPLVNSYMQISPTMKMLGTAVNHEFGEVEETAILITFDELYHEKKIRHVESYMKELLARFQTRFPNLTSNFKEVMLSKMNKRRSSSRSRWDRLRHRKSE
ncbi:MAG: GNAT family N-acetyltransferase [Bacteroidales bacterium]|nr:GNAT family N-acetyltransferase [Bacteroidales bacterium]